MSDYTPTHPLFSSRAIVHGLFLPKSINIIVGDAKSGRMRLAMTNFNSYSAPADPLFLDKHVPRPIQLGCILCSSEPEPTSDEIDGMGLDNLQGYGVFPIERWNASLLDPADRDNRVRSLEAVYLQFDHPDAEGNPKTRFGLPRFLLIENLIALSGANRSIDEEKIAVFLDQLQQFCNQYEVTILATVGTPKAKRGEYYPNVTHRIRGSAQWAEGIGTVIGVEEVLPTLFNGLPVDTAREYRKLTLKPPGQPEVTRWTRFQLNSQLVLVSEPQASTLTGQDTLDRKLLEIPQGEAIRPSVFYGWGMKEEMGERTIRRWIAACQELDLLRKEGNGPTTIYRRPLSN